MCMPSFLLHNSVCLFKAGSEFVAHIGSAKPYSAKVGFELLSTGITVMSEFY